MVRKIESQKRSSISKTFFIKCLEMLVKFSEVDFIISFLLFDLRRLKDPIVFVSIEDFHCGLVSPRGISLPGRVYVTGKGFVFYSKFFRKEKKLWIPFGHVSSISPPTGIFRQVSVSTGTWILLNDLNPV